MHYSQAMRDANAARVHAKPVMPAHNTYMSPVELLAYTDKLISDCISEMQRKHRRGCKVDKYHVRLKSLCDRRSVLLSKCDAMPQ